MKEQIKQQIKAEFEEKFLKNIDSPLGPDLNVTHGQLAYIGNLESFLSTSMDKVYETALKEVLEIVDGLPKNTFPDQPFLENYDFIRRENVRLSLENLINEK